MAGACGVNGETQKNAYTVSGHSDVGQDKIILKWVISKWSGRHELDKWLRIGTH
jgi:hypothetical protein